MNFKFTKESIEKINADLVFVVCFEKEGEKPVPATLQKMDGAQDLDKIFAGKISQTIKERQFFGKLGETLLINTFGKITAKNILIIGGGKPKTFTTETERQVGGKVTQVANAIKAESVGAVLELGKVHGTSVAERLQAFVEGMILASYSFDIFKKEACRIPKTLKTFLIQAKGNTATFQKVCAVAQVMGDATNLARDLTNKPSNKITPTALANAAQDVAKKHKNISCKVWGLKEIKAQKMGALLAVSQGSIEPPTFIHLTYKPSGNSKTKVALIGKGITFDSGGLNLKSRDQEFMKIDMGGAASVIGVFEALAILKPKIQVEGFIASCENMPSGSATRPGDILTTRAGTTVEVINTDAEGRLVLADALDYACEFNPTYMIDMATLTGGAAYALGELVTPILGNDKRLISLLLAAGQKAGERSWELPIIQDYKKGYLKGPADLKNSGSGSMASTISGALFLEDFARKNKWVHMDIASTSWAEEPNNYHTMIGATGNPVRTLLNFLMAL